MRKNNKANRTAKNNKIKAIVISMLPILAFLFSFLLVILGVKSYLENASYFKIKRIVLSGINDTNLVQNISRIFLYDNIFGLDLRKAREELKITNPQFYDVDVIKNFPDQITINAIVRRPVTQVKYKGFFLVDSEGVVVSDMSAKPFEEPIFISGLKGISSLSFGKKIHWLGFKSGLKLVQLLKESMQDLISSMPQLASEKIEIDLSKYPSFYVYLGSVETRLYDSDLESKLKLLVKILPTIKDRIGEVRYIDLRFVEPTLSFKKKR
ncbi:MAG: cell division protein FtsQ/DivIB [Candidatus Omnitrophica bacterium]|nr:cell division protein FtsQ/DivIB [Candidatus Omnitrophota bacterium]MDD5355243.1 cell division protein FtsQ/DivIB [Candidatus Omnitrophota bacterium]